MQGQGEKISIIIPAYIDTEEKQHWLQEAIQSAQKQSYKNKEIIVVDDCSPIPVQYGQAIRLNENVGTAIARNTAAYYATGKLLLPLDADDILMPNALELLYNSYEPNHFVYGNLTLFGIKEGSTTFPPFDCYTVLNTTGPIPVTALHSKEDHIKTGGWKSILKGGLEDVEYWISMVRQCVLGIRIEDVILHYRKHFTSRTETLRQNDINFGQTRATIRKIHEDLFSGGNMPCAGCGASKRHQTQSIKPKEIVSTNLQDYPESLLMTIQYNGPRSGSFGIVGPKTGVSYRIMGTGTQLKIHKDDWGRFKDLDAGKAFVIVTAAMQQPTKIVEPTEYKPNQPEIAEARKPQFDLSELDMSKDVTTLLAENGWTVEKIATEAVVGDLKDIKGIGPKTELRLMERAKALYYK